MLLFVKLRHGTFDECGSGTEDGDHPHPEQSTRAAEADTGCNTCDVAGTDTTCDREAECLEGRKSVIGGVAAEQHLYHNFDVTDLRRTQYDGE